MNDPMFPGPDPERSRLRSKVSRVERAVMAVLEKEGGAGASDTLRAAWDELVAQLALGPEPALRNCPVCGNAGMLAATRCINCWSKLQPPE